MSVTRNSEYRNDFSWEESLQYLFVLSTVFFSALYIYGQKSSLYCSSVLIGCTPSLSAVARKEAIASSPYSMGAE